MKKQKNFERLEKLDKNSIIYTQNNYIFLQNMQLLKTLWQVKNSKENLKQKVIIKALLNKSVLSNKMKRKHLSRDEAVKDILNTAVKIRRSVNKELGLED